jgi:hypothetical protein
MIRLTILRIVVILGYLPNLFLQWLCGDKNWLQEHHRIVRSMWEGKR